MRATFIQACACGKDLNHAFHIKPLFFYTPQTLDKCNNYWKIGFDETTAANLITNYNTQCGETYHQFSRWCAKNPNHHWIFDMMLPWRQGLWSLCTCCITCIFVVVAGVWKVNPRRSLKIYSTYPVRHPLFIMNFIKFCSDSHGSQRMNL